MDEITSAKDAYSSASKVWLDRQISNINNSAAQGNFVYDIHCEPDISYPITELIELCKGKRKVIDKRNPASNGSMPGSYGMIRIVIEPELV